MGVIEELKEIIDSSENIVFFGGAGVSTESGIPDFRSAEGLYNAKTEFGYAPEEIISHSFFMKDPSIFYEYYKKNMIYTDAKPNYAHKALAILEKEGKLKAVVTQNIDGLHQLAGSSNVLELHGSVHKNKCMMCGANYDLKYIMNEHNCKDFVPICDKCGGIVKPEVVLYEEPLDDVVVGDSLRAIESSDILIIGGTSLAVYPAANLINYFKGRKIVLINKTVTRADNNADIVIHNSLTDIMRLVVDIN